VASEAVDYVRYEFFESKNTSLKFFWVVAHAFSNTGPYV